MGMSPFYQSVSGVECPALNQRLRSSISGGSPGLIDECDSKAWETKAYEGTSSFPQRWRRSVDQWRLSRR